MATDFKATVCTLSAYDNASRVQDDDDATRDEQLVIVDSTRNLSPIINALKVGLAQRLYDAESQAALNTVIHSDRDPSALIVGMCMAMWTMAAWMRVRPNRDLFTMLSIACEIVPWQHLATTRQVFIIWTVSIYRAVLAPFAHLRCDAQYRKCAVDYLNRVEYFRASYERVGADMKGKVLRAKSEDDLKTWFYTTLVSGFDQVGPVINDMTFHFITLTDATRLERALDLKVATATRKRRGANAAPKTTKWLHPYVNVEDTRLISFVRSVLLFVAHGRMQAYVLGHVARRRYKRLIASSVADRAMRALIDGEEQARCARLAVQARALERKRQLRVARAERRAYTVHAVWERHSLRTWELVMRLEIDFPCNSKSAVACPQAPPPQYCAMRDEVLRMLRGRWAVAMMEDGEAGGGGAL
jgi:hypothetical protein